MIGQIGSHRRCSAWPFLWQRIFYGQAQAFVWAHEVVVAVFPSCGRLMKLQFFGEGERFTCLTTVEEAAGQVTAFDIRRAFAQESNDFGLGTLDHADFGSLKTTLLIPLLDPLKVYPVRTGLLAGGRPTMPAVFRDDAVDFDHGFINATPAIGNRRR